MSVNREKRLIGPTDLPVQDADKELVVTITDDDRNAVQCSPTQCVIANALNRIPSFSNAHVGATMVYVDFKGITLRYEISRNGASMIRAYDNDGQVMPAGISLTLLPPVVRERGMRSAKQLNAVGSVREPSSMSRRSRKPNHRSIWVEPATLMIAE